MSELLAVKESEVQASVHALGASMQLDLVDTSKGDSYFTIADKIVDVTDGVTDNTDLVRAEVMSDVLDKLEAKGRDVSALRNQFALDVKAAHTQGIITNEQANYLYTQANQSREVDSSNTERKGRVSGRTRLAATVLGLAVVAGVVSCTANASAAESVPRRAPAAASKPNPKVSAPEVNSGVLFNLAEQSAAEATGTEASVSSDVVEAPQVDQAALSRFVEARYGSVDTGDNAQHLIGDFEIDTSNADRSAENFYNELRRNPESLGFWGACVGTGTPSYEACVGNPDTLALAENLVQQYRAMPIGERAEAAEELIAQFKNMNLDGVQSFTGSYGTVSISTDGMKIFGSTNYRDNDPRLVFTDADGNTFKIRGCAQIVEEKDSVPTSPMQPPAPEQPPEGPKEPEQPPEEPEEPEQPPEEPEEEPPTTTTTTTTPPPPTHAPADGPPPEATIPPLPQPGTPGYDPGNAEDVDETQGNETPGGLDPTEHGTPAPDGSPGPDETEVSTPGEDAPNNPDHEPGSETPGTDEGIDRDNPDSDSGAENDSPSQGGTPFDPLGVAAVGLAGAYFGPEAAKNLAKKVKKGRRS